MKSRKRGFIPTLYVLQVEETIRRALSQACFAGCYRAHSAGEV